MKPLTNCLATLVLAMAAGCGARPGKIPPPKTYTEADIPALVQLLSSPSQLERDKAARELERFGSASVPAVVDLFRRRAEYPPPGPFEPIDVNKAAREGSIDGTISLVLIRIGRPSVAPLRTLMSSQNANVRRRAATTLGGIGADAIDAVAELSNALKDSDDGVRFDAAAALWRVDPKRTKESVAVLETFQDSFVLRDSAAATLKEIREKGKGGPKK